MKDIVVIHITPDRIEEALFIYAKAREFMKKSGNPDQWRDNYPPRETVEKDIQDKTLYGFEKDGRICALFVLQGHDSVYDTLIDGSWLNSDEYLAIHRVASNGEVKGILSLIVGFAKGFNRDLRIDTHDDNLIMQHLLEKNGFIRCGRVRLPDGEERITYHLVCQK
jgi:hypothetical protein